MKPHFLPAQLCPLTNTAGVYRYDPKQAVRKIFTWFTEKGPAGPAALGLFEDKNATIRFGNNGSGLFRYDLSGELRTGTKSLTEFYRRKRCEQQGIQRIPYFDTTPVSQYMGQVFFRFDGKRFYQIKQKGS